MTWSIVARDAATGAYGVAVTTKFFAVGALCPYAQSGIGALATQALVNPLYGRRGLALIAGGMPAEEVVRQLTDADDGRATRQLHLVDSAGRTAAWTGTDCIGWCGSRQGQVGGHGFSVAGNMLAGEAVVNATFERFAAASDLPLAARFIVALEAGQAQGGDKRGKQSAALIVYAGEDYADLDLRVDDHEEPLAELKRLHGISQGRAAAFRTFMASKANPAGVFDRTVIEAEVARREAALG